MDNNFWKELIIICGAIFVQFLSLAAVWWKFRTEIANNTKDIRHHTDISVQKLNGMLTYVVHSFDRPAWIKLARETDQGIEFRMLEVNQEYTDIFGIARTDYIGRTDLEAGWHKEEADRFYEHDLMVWASGESQTFVELVNGKPMRFRKIRVQTADGKKKGIMSYAVGCDDFLNCPFWED